MALAGASFSVLGSICVLVDAFDRWRNVTTTIGGGSADTDWAAVNRQIRRRAAASGVGPLLVLVGAILTLFAL